MRKHIKKQLTELLNTIKEAHHELSLLCFEREKEADIADILTMCQQAAISVGTSIEESEGEGTHAVTLLENYCELLYETHVKLQENMGDNSETDSQNVIGNGIISSHDIGTIVSVLNAKIDEAIYSIDNDIKERKEVVFLPYKSSMWDSLESVWMECMEDETCDAYVVPIPYYDKNADGSFGKFHYEIDEYPENVPVISWEQYDVAARKPDVIFIHNPYDGCNKVTSVHPDYYAANLKKYTDELIYVPYFICINDVVPEHFVVLPGTIHAHKVIVQSERVKEQYIDVFTREMTAQGVDVKTLFGDLNDKFLALGSPKIDKVLRTTRDNIDIPPEWEELINQGMDKRHRRKVMLYNTTLQAFMNNSQQYVDKIIRVLETFRKNEKIVLLWRPHPLLKETIASMYPDRYNRYVEVTDRFKKEKWGIYDDTSDVHRAIALSDAYYGDMSSLVEMYKATGKPIMIQNVEV